MALTIRGRFDPGSVVRLVDSPLGNGSASQFALRPRPDADVLESATSWQRSDSPYWVLGSSSGAPVAFRAITVGPEPQLPLEPDRREARRAPRRTSTARTTFDWPT